MLEVGEIAELRFALEARRRGLMVSKPLTTARYDLVVDGGGRLSRVQVKAISKPEYGNTYHCHLTRGLGSRSRYKANEIDFFALYLVTADLWYFVPSALVVGSCVLRIDPNRGPRVAGTKPLLDYPKFKGAWNLFALCKK